MAQVEIDNQTPFVVEPLYLLDEQSRDALTVVAKATFNIHNGQPATLAEHQQPLCLAGELWPPTDASSTEEPCYLCEPEIAPYKPYTDLAVVAHAYAPNTRTTVMDVGVQIGAVRQQARVFGNRVWFKSTLGLTMTAPMPFERLPLSYQYAFGGWDRSADDAMRHDCELRNPVGRGFFARHYRFLEERPAPNLEDPGHAIRSPEDRPAPVGFGFVSPNWSPRKERAGTCDAAWKKSRSPRLPEDFDARFFSAASPGLVMPRFLRGGEAILTSGMTPEGVFDIRLPKVATSTATVVRRGKADHRLTLVLDTVLVRMDARQVLMLFRACMPLPGGPHELRAVRVTGPTAVDLQPQPKILSARDAQPR